MHAHKINHLPTSQGDPAHMFHTRKEHPAGTGSVVTTVKLPKTMHVDGMPNEAFSISVTPSVPAIVSISNQTRHSFDVTLTSPNGGAIAAGVLSILVVG
jgi:hypothetical protein